MIERVVLKNREEWLKQRKRIGGSDAAALVGMNPYMNNVELWEIKTGRKTHDVADNDSMKYGREAENHLRALFALDFPQYEIGYIENNMFINDKYPFAHASLDGWIKDQAGRTGILEIKTATIESTTQKLKWKDKIPDNYYCQVCWYMGVCEADFAVVKAQLKMFDNEIITKHYFIERADVQDDIELLLLKGSEFWQYCKNDIQPPLVLPTW